MKNRIQAEIAKRHNMTVGDNDPVWIVATVCELMAEEYSRKLSDQQDVLAKKFKEKIKEVNKRTNALNIAIAVLFGIIIGLSIQLII
ncbi:hypothetical protein DO021_01930 [Desulfobacter hydrogenophilus]|uniref:Uncharacterized protein n=1 Tax=Desulfobacter hydrogenophilus TaxID=2291 RepID=A0A328FK14_9BACT|nr:hypothetical protein [Desulfobacter hydrogenophilus]NDY73122.1 hypothetical protein [Desulfobacter hydrogenophilus]QBH14799.1 hypothetical protein EYB58_18890 [Desulfobacter hydrogenophilus]RAM03832.1 hypothetical protein DO021_01930 [Desulfobacter hydrogenophilus]